MKTEEMKYGPGNYMTCAATDLQSYTMSGWDLVTSYQDQVVEQSYDMTPVVVNGYPQQQPITESFAVLKTTFVLRKSTDKVMEDLRARVDGLVKERADAEKFGAAAAKELNDAKQSLADAERDCERARKAVDSTIEASNAAMAAKRKLEEDMGKLREAIGSVKFNEIVNPKVTA